ncbi:MAG: AMP-binding protein [Proteobacteria bacterium]|nr:AMP-binding protein [Pseudomonadota bacterium]
MTLLQQTKGALVAVARERAASDARSLSHAIFRLADETPDRICLRFVGKWSTDIERAITCRELEVCAGRVAASLRADEVQPGHTVGMIISDALQFLSCFFGIVLAGGIAVPLPPTHALGRKREWQALVAQARREVGFGHIIADEARQPMLSEIADASALIMLNPSELNRPGLSWSRTSSRDTDGPVLIQYTPGSCGGHKGVLHHHSNLMANVRGVMQSHMLTFGSVTVSWVPLHHDYGLIATLLPNLLAGGEVIVMAPMTFATKPARLLEAASRYHAHNITGTSATYRWIVDRMTDGADRGLNLSALRCCSICAESIDADAIDAFVERFADLGVRRKRFVPAYGLAEFTVAATSASVGEGAFFETFDADRLSEGIAEIHVNRARPSYTLVSSGRPIPGHAVIIVDDDRVAVGHGQVGEVALCGPSLMAGYVGEASSMTSVSEGWLYTGDVGFLWQDELFVLGRAAEMIRIGDRIWFPHLLESLAETPGNSSQARAAAFADGDDRVRLIVEDEAIPVRTDESNRDEKVGVGVSVERRVSLRRRLGAVLGDIAFDVTWVALNGLPRTTSGKVQRLLCKQQYEAGQLGFYV